MNAGDGWIEGIAARPGAMPGPWRAECCELGRRDAFFVVRNPAGRIVGRALIGRPFVGEIEFTILPGAAEFEHGDAFEIPVTQDSQQDEAAHGPAQDETRDPAVLGERSA